MKIGFTGTRNGMTSAQKMAFASLIESLKPTEFHHGDCVGADDEAATMVHESSYATVTCHPPTDEKLRAWNPKATFTVEAKTHFARNRDIVNETDMLIGTPGAPTWQPRGGTFYTMDYAIKRGKPVKVIWPDGTVEDR